MIIEGEEFVFGKLAEGGRRKHKTGATEDQERQGISPEPQDVSRLPARTQGTEQDKADVKDARKSIRPVLDQFEGVFN